MFHVRRRIHLVADPASLSAWAAKKLSGKHASPPRKLAYRILKCFGEAASNSPRNEVK